MEKKYLHNSFQIVLLTFDWYLFERLAHVITWIWFFFVGVCICRCVPRPCPMCNVNLSY